MSLNNDDEIIQIFEDNKLRDLKRFLNKRQRLNCCNMYLSYIFHFIQSVGIITTTIATGYDIKPLIWGGIGINVIASLIQIYEQLNNSMLQKLMNDIKLIRSGNYLDEGLLIDIEDSKQPKEQTNNNTNN
jgi:hypothetical protein